jgi:hypothetical protein
MVKLEKIRLKILAKRTSFTVCFSQGNTTWGSIGFHRFPYIDLAPSHVAQWPSECIFVSWPCDCQCLISHPCRSAVSSCVCSPE